MMPIVVSRRCVYFVVCGVLLASAGNAEAKLYRWENAEGKVIYSDQIPPEEAMQKRESLNKDAHVTEVIEGAKTKEQWELEKRLEALRKEQEKIIAKQKADDKVLLSTFRSENDIRAALKSKILAIDGQQKVAEGNELRLQQQLKTQQRDAAKYERKGSAVPQPLLDDIASTNQQIAEAREEVKKQMQKKEQVTKEFEADIARFVFLTKSSVAAEKISDSSAELKAADELGVVSCDSNEQCDKAWQIARTFVQKHSSTAIDVDSDKLIMGSDPRTEQDMSLSVSRIVRQGYKTQIFLDIRCYKSSKGEELCSGAKVRELRTAFRPFIEAGLTAQ